MTGQHPFAHEFPIGRSSGRCAVCSRLLEPGEVYYAAIWQEGDEYVRRDFDAACWRQPPPDALGAWKARVPLPRASGRRRPAPVRLLMGVFERLGEAGGEAAAKLRFVLGLLLLRRRVLRDGGRTEEGGLEVWRMRRPADESVFDVVCPSLSAQDVEEVSRQLAELLAGLEEGAEAVG
jgi:hypothetical protein